MVMAFSLAGCGKKKEEEPKTIKVGVIMPGDKTYCYNKAHIEGILKAAKEVGLASDRIIWKYNVPRTERCAKVAEELVAQGCDLIISNSYDHQDSMREEAEKNSDVDFVAVSGDHAKISDLDNYYNAYPKSCEGRYVSGVVAGMKIKELVKNKKISAKKMDKDGNVKVGFVGSYPITGVVSDYTAFFLGIKSVYPKVAMEVEYANSWLDKKKEASLAKKLIDNNCVVLAQITDSTAVFGECEKANKAGKNVYCVGYYMDMLSVAPKSTLTSVVFDWSVYYTELFNAVMDEDDIPQDWSKGVNDGAVKMGQLGPKVAKNTDAKVNEVEKRMKDGSIKVFDTKSFTVNGKEVKSSIVDLSYIDASRNKVIFEGEKEEAINDGAFEEGVLRSSPYFSLRIDGITENPAK